MFTKEHKKTVFLSPNFVNKLCYSFTVSSLLVCQIHNSFIEKKHCFVILIFHQLFFSGKQDVFIWRDHACSRHNFRHYVLHVHIL